MSKEIFMAIREEEMRARIDIPYMMYKDLKDQWEYEEEIKYGGSYNPKERELFKKDKEWSQYEQTIKECRAEQRIIESKIRVDGFD